MSLIPNCTYCQSSSAGVQPSHPCSHDRIDHWLTTAKRMAPLFFSSLGTGIGAIIVATRADWKGHPLRLPAAIGLVFMLGHASYAFGKDIVRLMDLKDAGVVRAVTGIYNKISGTNIDAQDVLSRREQTKAEVVKTTICVPMEVLRNTCLATLSSLPSDEADRELITWVKEKINLLTSEEILSNLAPTFFDALREADSELYSLLSKHGPTFFQSDFQEAKGKLYKLLRMEIIAFLERVRGDEASSFTFDQKLRLAVLYALEDQKDEKTEEAAIAALTSLQDECKQPNSPLFQKVKDHLKDKETPLDLSIFKMLVDLRLEAQLFALVCACKKELAITAGLMTPEN